MSLGRVLAVGAAWARLRAGWSLYGSMQLDGAWMMRAPWSRALVRNVFMVGTISSSRRTAFRQWWASHMSQTMTAVFLAGHACSLVATVYLPSASTRDRRVSLNAASSAEQGAAPANRTAAPNRKVERMVGPRG